MWSNMTEAAHAAWLAGIASAIETGTLDETLAWFVLSADPDPFAYADSSYQTFIELAEEFGWDSSNVPNPEEADHCEIPPWQYAINTYLPAYADNKGWEKLPTAAEVEELAEAVIAAGEEE